MQNIRWKIAQWFEGLWWKNYTKSKSTKDYLTWKKNYWINFLEKLSFDKDELNEPLIDVGCGPAGIFILFDDRECVALDPLLESYEDLDIFSKSEYPKIHFEASSFEDYKEDNLFQTVFCLNAINHFIDIEKSFEKLNTICHSNGKLILSIDAHNHGFFRKLFSWIPFDILHPHQYNLKEYKDMLQYAGFRIEQEVLMKEEFFFNYWILVAKKVS